MNKIFCPPYFRINRHPLYVCTIIYVLMRMFLQIHVRLPVSISVFDRVAFLSLDILYVCVLVCLFKRDASAVLGTTLCTCKCACVPCMCASVTVCV